MPSDPCGSCFSRQRRRDAPDSARCPGCLLTPCPDAGRCRARKGCVGSVVWPPGCSSHHDLPWLSTSESLRLREAACLGFNLYARENYGAFQMTSSCEISTGLLDAVGNGDRRGASWGLGCSLGLCRGCHSSCQQLQVPRKDLRRKNLLGIGQVPQSALGAQHFAAGPAAAGASEGA